MTTRRGTVGQLLFIGRHTARRGTVRRVALFPASVALGIALAAIVTVVASYAGVDRRADERGPNTLYGKEAAAATGLWRITGDTLLDQAQHDVIYIEPLGEDAPLPPGLPRWPKAGEAYLSPALLEAGDGEGIGNRYGELAGVIGPEGLATRTERLAYVRPAQSMQGNEAALPTDGFGSGAALRFGDSDGFRMPPEWGSVLSMVAFLLVPALALAVVAARTGGEARERRTALLAALGARSRHRALLHTGEVLAPALAGAVVAAAGVVLSLVTMIRLPLVDAAVAAADQRAYGAWLIACPIAGFLLLLGIVTVSHRLRLPGRRARTVTRPVAAKTRSAWPWVCLVAMVAVVWVPPLISERSVRTQVYLLLVVIVFVTLPSLLAALLRMAAEVVAAAGRRWGAGGMLVAGRHVAAHPRPTARLVAALVVAIGLLGQAQLQLTRGSADTEAASAAQRKLGTSVLLAQPGRLPEDLREFVTSLPSDVLSVRITQYDDTEQLVLRAPCTALKSLGLPCEGRVEQSPIRADDRVAYMTGTEYAVRVDDGASYTAAAEADTVNHTQLALFSRDGSDISVGRVKQLAYVASVGGFDIQATGGLFLGGSAEATERAYWMILLGLITLLLLGATTALAALAEYARLGRQIAPTTMLTHNRSLYYRVGVWTLFIPMVVAGVTGVMVSTLLSADFAAKMGAHTSAELMNTMLVACCAMGAVTWLLGARSTARAARLWRPEAD